MEMSLEQYKKKMKCAPTKLKHIGQEISRNGNVIFNWYVDWKRGLTFCVANDITGEDRICHMFEYMAGANPDFNGGREDINEYTTEIKQLDSWKI